MLWSYRFLPPARWRTKKIGDPSNSSPDGFDVLDPISGNVIALQDSWGWIVGFGERPTASVVVARNCCFDDYYTAVNKLD